MIEPEEYICFMDNLHGHQCEEYRASAKKSNIKLFFTPPDTTDICAVNDHHIGKMVKTAIKKKFKEHFYDNMDFWEDEAAMKDKRILLTQYTETETEN